MSIITTLHPHRILHLLFSSREALTLTMHRMQEFYESPYAGINGQYFTEEGFLARYSDPSGSVPYFTLYEGFNLPLQAIVSFSSCFSGRFTAHEQHFLELLDKQWWDASGRGLSYIIATDPSSEPSTLLHELAHAYWSVDEVYCHAAGALLANLPAGARASLKHDLLKYDYASVVLDDELQAYLATSTLDELAETFHSFTREALAELSTPFHSLQEFLL